MKGNGFKFGSKTTPQSTSVKITADHSIAFNHKSKGFDNINYPILLLNGQITDHGTELNSIKILKAKLFIHQKILMLLKWIYY